MSPEILLAFIAACILLGLTPGPNMSLILASTLSSESAPAVRRQARSLPPAFATVSVRSMVSPLGRLSGMR